MDVNFQSFLFGIFIAYFMDVLFSISNFFIQKAFYLRDQRKASKECDKS